MKWIVNEFQPLTVSAKRFILDVWQSSEYASVTRLGGCYGMFQKTCSFKFIRGVLNDPFMRSFYCQKQPPEKCSKKLPKFARKTPVMKSLFNKVAGLQVCNFIRKRLQHRCFPAKVAKFLRTPKEHLRTTASIKLHFMKSPLKFFLWINVTFFSKSNPK